MFNFLELDPESFGIDISDSSIKIVRLKKDRKFFKLASWGETDVEPGIIEDGEVKDEDALSKAIKKAVDKVKGEKLDTVSVVASLPESKAFLQIIKMPKLDLAELREAVVFEAENYVPLPIEKCFIDFEIIKSVKSFQDHLNVLIVAFPKELAMSYFISLSRAGLLPRAFEIESQSISRSMVKNEFSSEPVLIIDLGKNNTSFAIFHGYSLLFTSSLSLSADSFTKAVSESLKISLVEAEKVKCKRGIIPSMAPVMKDLVSNVKKYLSYYTNHCLKEDVFKEGETINKILLCGGGANLKGLPESISSAVKIPVSLGNPWVNILPSAIKEVPGLGYKESIGYSTAFGLALRGVKKEND